MSEAFTRKPDFTPYTPVVPGNLCGSTVGPSLVPACNDLNAEKTAAVPILQNKQWWARATKNFNFEVEDKLDPEAFNRVLWTGIKGDQLPYVTERNHADLRQNRDQLLKNNASVGIGPLKNRLITIKLNEAGI